MRANEARARHYKWVRVSNWAGDMVVSYFLRCCLEGKTLFVEVSSYVLPPLDASHRKIDAQPPTGWRTKLQWLLIALFTAPFAALCAPFLLFAKLSMSVPPPAVELSPRETARVRHAGRD